MTLSSKELIELCFLNKLVGVLGSDVRCVVSSGGIYLFKGPSEVKHFNDRREFVLWVNSIEHEVMTKEQAMDKLREFGVNAVVI